MVKLEWQESLSVGNAGLDNDHKKLVKIIQSIWVYQPQSANIGDLFAELGAYTKFHFSREEKLMKDANLPNITEHKASHRNFVEWLHSVRYVVTMSGESRNHLLESVDDYLQNWLSHHILETDMNYKGLI